MPSTISKPPAPGPCIFRRFAPSAACPAVAFIARSPRCSASVRSPSFNASGYATSIRHFVTAIQPRRSRKSPCNTASSISEDFPATTARCSTSTRRRRWANVIPAGAGSGRPSPLLLRALPRRLLGRLLRYTQIMRGIDQRDVRQRLPEIAGLATGGRIVLLGQEARIVGDRDHAVKQLLRASEVARQHIGIRQPQRAGEKRAFCR